MNSFVLMAKIVAEPQLRYTQESELRVTETIVEFDNVVPNNPPSKLKVVAWNNLAEEVKNKYTKGQQVMLSGRLKMDTITTQEGFKQKTAQLILSNIEPINSSSSNTSEDDFDFSPPDYSEQVEAGSTIQTREYTPEPENEPQLVTSSFDDQESIADKQEDIPF